MKKEWTSPRTNYQEFTPQEFIAACDQSGATQTYYFVCDGGYATGKYDVILDTNGNHQLDGQWVRTLNPSTWEFTYVWNGDDTLLTAGKYFHPCNQKHQVTVPYGQSVEATFPYGWMQTKSSYSNNNWTAVRIWRGDNNDNIHCTTNLREEDYIPHNPS